MPFYEYECPHCGYDEEVLQKITDKPLTKCPNCGKKGLKKHVGVSALVNVWRQGCPQPASGAYWKKPG